MGKENIRNFTLAELEESFRKIQEPSYRAKQVFGWIYRMGISNFGQMKNIPKPLKEKLASYYNINTLEPSEHLKSKQNTEKLLFKLPDGNFIETVLICKGSRKTVCLSTQVGCKFNCTFCASGMRGFKRDLTPSEIVSQLLFVQYALKHKITNLVFMGMGEPLDNYGNVSKAIMIINDPEGISIGARRITVSTCGIVPGIEKLSGLGLQVNLSISLHAGNDKLRDQLVPVNKRYPLGTLIKACKKYLETTGRIITLEYVLIKGRNDSHKDADELAAIAKTLKAKVNLIACNAVPAMGVTAPERKDVNAFMQDLIKRGVIVTLRESKGDDIFAACGQLAGKKYRK